MTPLGTDHGILNQAWSPIGGITFYRDSGHASALKDPAIGRIAQAHGKSPAQVMLRWGIQHGRSVIPKSTKPARIAENLDVFDFQLDDEEIAAIDALERQARWSGSRGHRPGPVRHAHHRSLNRQVSHAMALRNPPRFRLRCIRLPLLKRKETSRSL